MNTKEIVAKSHSAIDTVIKNEKDLIEKGLAEYWGKWFVANNTILCFLVTLCRRKFYRKRIWTKP